MFARRAVQLTFVKKTPPVAPAPSSEYVIHPDIKGMVKCVAVMAAGAAIGIVVTNAITDIAIALIENQK